MDKGDIFKLASSVRIKLNVRNEGAIDLFTMINEVPNMTVVYYPMGANISGMFIRNNKTPLIAINSAMSIGRQHFSLAHELYHFYHDNKDISVSSRDIGNDNEKNADLFASYLLIPMDDFMKSVSNISIDNITINDVIKLEQYYKVSRQAILRRLFEENKIDDIIKKKFSTNVILSAVNLGYDDALYKASPDDKVYRTYGEYIKLADRLLINEKISIGKYEELLISAYRSELVYGEILEELND